MHRLCSRTTAFYLLLVFAQGCATPPPLPPALPTVSFETKMSWIIRLEDQRILRDEAVPIAPPPATKGKQVVMPLPPPPPDLLRLLNDEEARVRRRAAMAVGRVGLADGVPPLVRLLQSDKDPEVRQMAAFALGLIGDQSAVAPLQAAVVDPSLLVAGRAAEALGLIGDTSSAPIIGTLIAAQVDAAAALTPDDSRVMFDEKADAFRLAVFALTRLKAYGPLAAAVIGADGEPRVRWWPVAYALQRIEDARALPALRSLARTESTYMRAFAIKGLGTLKDAESVPILLPLIDAAHASSLSTIEAIRAMGRIGDARGEPVLTKLLYTRGLNPMVRAEVLLALGDSAAAVSVDAFVDFMGDPLPTVRLAALQGFAKRDDDSFLTVLSGLDADPHWSVRAGLASVLATKDPERALPRLMPMLDDTDAHVIPAVLAALTKLRAPEIDTILVERLESEDVGVRAAAAMNLGELKPPAAVDALVAAYTRGEADLVIEPRAAAIEALSKYGATAAMPTLRAALRDKDWAVRVKAAGLLKALDPTESTDQAMRPAPSARPVSYDRTELVNPTVSPHVYVDTDKGTIEIELDVMDAPLTVDNFMMLARKGFFNGLPLHRVVPDFVVQGGDPRGDGEGGPGYTIRDELNQKPFLRGTLGMALAWRDTGGSQFFIAHGPQPHLDARYTVFGRVVAGMEIVDKITQWDVMQQVRVWDGEK